MTRAARPLASTDRRRHAGGTDALVSATGLDVGLRTARVLNRQLSVAVWRLTLDSELLFLGDAGTTEASRASKRQGIEAAALWNPLSWLIVDADFAWSHARFSDNDPAGDRRPVR